MSVDTVAPIAGMLTSILEDAKRILDDAGILVPDSLFKGFEDAIPRSNGFCSALGRSLSPGNTSGLTAQEVGDFRWAMQLAWAKFKH